MSFYILSAPIKNEKILARPTDDIFRRLFGTHDSQAIHKTRKAVNSSRKTAGASIDTSPSSLIKPFQNPSSPSILIKLFKPIKLFNPHQTFSKPQTSKKDKKSISISPATQKGLQENVTPFPAVLFGCFTNSQSVYFPAIPPAASRSDSARGHRA